LVVKPIWSGLQSETQVYEREKKRANRARQRVLLTEAELKLVDSAVAESGASNRSLFISEAIQAGLRNFDVAKVEGRRNRRIDAWIPREFRDGIKELAQTYASSQQSILRQLILGSARAANWKHPAAPTQTAEEDTQ
jgi:hypothetical protein